MAAGNPISSSSSVNGEVTLRDLRSNPKALLALGLSLVVVLYFYCFVGLFSAGALSTFKWAWQAWNAETNYEHARFIPLIFLFLLWHKRKDLLAAPLGKSNWGLLILLFGILLYLGAARTLQARIALGSLPIVLWGGVLFALGPKIARILLFPIGFLFFMVPLNFIEQATFKLQFIITGVAQFVCNFIGIKLTAIGTTLRAADDSFGFDIAEGCSGINSLMAMTMVAALYVHFTQDKLWKKILIFSAAALFAIIGNAGRIVTIVLVAKFINPDIAAGIYHDYATFIFFPIALAAMIGFAKLLNPKPKRRSVDTSTSAPSTVRANSAQQINPAPAKPDTPLASDSPANTEKNPAVSSLFTPSTDSDLDESPHVSTQKAVLPEANVPHTTKRLRKYAKHSSEEPSASSNNPSDPSDNSVDTPTE